MKVLNNDTIKHNVNSYMALLTNFFINKLSNHVRCSGVNKKKRVLLYQYVKFEELRPCMLIL